MTELEKLFATKKTENGDISFRTTGDNLTDLFFMTAFFEKHLDQVKIGTSEREKVFSMFVRDPRFGLGRRDLGRELMKQAKVPFYYITTAGRYDDLWHIPTSENLNYLRTKLNEGDELAKKWMPRLTGKDKKIAKALCKEWGLTEKEYRKLIKTDSTVEYKLSYAEKNIVNINELERLFDEAGYAKAYIHPLVNEIDFEKVPSLAMVKYLHTFSTRDDLKERFGEYIENVKNEKAKLNVKTADVTTAYKTATTRSTEATDVVAKKIVENETIGVELDAICVLDTSGSMYWGYSSMNIGEKATAVAHAIATHSTYARNQIISFSSNPHLMTIKGNTLQEQYKSMYTGDCSYTDFGKVMDLLKGLKKYPEYIIVMSDMEFDQGSYQSKKQLMDLFKKHEAKTKLIWWNFNDRNKTVPEFDEYGNIYLSGYNLQILRLLENKFDMTTYIDKILEKYKKDIDYKA